MQSIRSLKNLKGKTVLLRTDFNVPIKNSKVVDDYRIRKALPSISYLKKQGASIVIISHSGLENNTQSLGPASHVLGNYVKHRFIKEPAPRVINLAPGEVVLLENLRRDKGEMNNSVTFAKKLASYADLYVNDAFSVSHRPHTSIVGIPKHLPSYAGLEFEEEIAHLSSIFKPAHPFFVILSGAKFSTKLPLLTKFLTLADNVFVGGALLNDLLLSAGYEVGKSLVENNKKTQSQLKKLFTHPKLILPEDLLVKRSGSTKNVPTNEVGNTDQIVDVGVRTTLTLCEIGKQSKLVLWNGPLGIYEDGYDKGTRVLLNTLASSKGDTIIGGGDTGALVTKSGLEKKFHFVSIGGGATLEFLAHGTLVGIKALEFKNKNNK